MPTHRIIKRDGLDVAEEIKRLRRDFGGQLISIIDTADHLEIVFSDPTPETRDGAA